MMHQPTPQSPATAQPPVKRKPRPVPVRFTDWASI